MDAAFATIGRGLDDLASVDLALLTVNDLQRGLVGTQKIIDRATVIQARFIQEASVRGFTESGARDTASWVASKTRTSKGTASKQAQLGKALDTHPELAKAVDAGDISPDAAGMLVPVLDSNHSGDAGDLVDACKGASPEAARAAGFRFRELHPPEGSTPEDREHELRKKRSLRFSNNDDGTTRVDGTLTALDAQLVQSSLRSILGKPTVGDDRTFDQKMADALVQLCSAYSNGSVRGGRSNLPTIIVTIDVNDLNGNTDGPGFTSRGDVIPAEAVRNLTSNAFLQRVILDGSKPLDVGRASRLATEDQWRTMVARDGGCRFADCQIPPEWCEADHIHDWDAQHGPTNIDLLVLWCVYHHHFRHRPDVKLIGDANDLSIRLPDGRVVPLPPRGPTHASKGAAATNQGNLFEEDAA
ncbi:MAG: hypothetical protein JWN62_4063 [Acidimicrobiales bacterium]|nr:hypothetical protein [Acidimicrobiales bacterium]